MDQKDQSYLSHYNTSDLRKKWWMFKAMSFPVLSTIGPAILEKSIQLGLPVKSLVKSTLFEQFCGGEDLEECLPVVTRLQKMGLHTVLDYGVESDKVADQKDAVVKELKRVIDFTAKNSHVEFGVLKLSALVDDKMLHAVTDQKKLNKPEQKAWDQFEETAMDLFQYAHQKKVRVFVDAEQSWIQGAIDQIAELGMRTFNKERAIVYTTMQMYRHDRLEYLKKMIQEAKNLEYILGVKIVRGAYLEGERDRAFERGYPSPIQKDKASTDKDFDEGLLLCIENIDFVAFCCGSHNQNSCELAATKIKELKLDPKHSHIDFSQLYGMSDFLSILLRDLGFRVSKYLPYGPVEFVVPYLIRRARENSSVTDQTQAELEAIKLELNRRKP